MDLLGRNNKTLRPVRNTLTTVGNKGLQFRKHVAQTLGRGDISAAVALPDGEDLHEWLAFNIVDFYNAISLLYSTLEDFCTEQSCEVMSAGSTHEYRWADGVKVKKPLRLSAPKYIEALFDWIVDQIDDPAVFPQQMGSAFPPDFLEVTRTILKRLFRVYAHIYHSHYKHISDLEESKHLNACFKHFLFFTLHFKLVGEADLAPLKELIDQFTGNAKPAASTSTARPATLSSAQDDQQQLPAGEPQKWAV